MALSPADAFAAACVAGLGAYEAIALRDAHPGLTDELGRHGRIALVMPSRPAAPKACACSPMLGFDLSGRTAHDGAGLYLVTPLHNAAWMGEPAMVQLLLELGADPQAVDPTYGATPQGWAEHNHQTEVAAFLAGTTRRR